MLSKQDIILCGQLNILYELFIFLREEHIKLSELDILCHANNILILCKQDIQLFGQDNMMSKQVIKLSEQDIKLSQQLKK